MGGQPGLGEREDTRLATVFRSASKEQRGQESFLATLFYKPEQPHLCGLAFALH